METYNKKRAC